MEKCEKQKEGLTKIIEQMGYPKELGVLIGKQLGTEKTIQRMIRYLHSAKPRSAEEIVDEMLAITADRDNWMRKKQSEYYNQKMNELIWYGLDVEPEDDPEET